MNQLPTSISARNLRGILLPIPTPFDSHESLHSEALQSNIERWNKTGILGYALLGSTGERVHLDEREFLSVIETARKAVPDGLAFIVGAGQQSTRGTIDEIQRASSAGAQAALVITPSFYRSAITQTLLSDYYTAVAEAASIPIVLYSMPALTGIKIDPETIYSLSGHPNIIGVKDSAADMENFARTVRLVRGDSATVRDDFAVLTGNGTVLHEALKLGADGGILAVGCVAAELCLQIFQTVKSGDLEASAKLQERLTPLAQAVTTKYGIGGLKAALDRLGYYGGPVRAPLRSPDQAAQNEINELVSSQ